MAARLIDGKAVAARVRAQVKEDVAAFSAANGGQVPGAGEPLPHSGNASAGRTRTQMPVRDLFSPG